MDPIMFKSIHPYSSQPILLFDYISIFSMPISADLLQINCSELNFLSLILTYFFFQMPGTIHVTVLEFKGVSSSPKPSAKSLKVSMGKRQYQTWDKGDFSFPISKIQENLVVALLDAGGNEIAHQDIRTIQIIEKGSWDEVFSINGGGNVHLKLQFTLSDEDRNRIRVMRESALKKKLETNPSIRLRFLEAAPSTSESIETLVKDEQQVSASIKGFVEIDLTTSLKVEASQAGSSLPSATSSAVSLSNHRTAVVLVPDSAIPVKELSNATDGSEGAPSSPVEHEIVVESARLPDEKTENTRLANLRSDKEDVPSISDKNNAVASTLQDDCRVRKPQKLDPVKRTPSNVRKMISAFENTQLQEVKSMKRAASVPSQLNKFRKEVLLENQSTKLVFSPANKALTDFENHDVTNLHKLPTTTASERAGNALSNSRSSQVEKELSSTVTPTLSEGSDLYAEVMSRSSSSGGILKKAEESSVGTKRQLASETATSSGRMSEEQSQVPQPHELSSRLLKSSESSVAEGSGSGRGRGTGLTSSTMNNIQVASNPKPNSLGYCKEEYHSARSSGMWIFPDNTSRLCITTAGEQVMNIVGHHHNEAKIHQANDISSETQKNLVHEKEHKIEKNTKKIDHQPESGSASPPSDSSNGLIGQVIKVAVIVGFAVLVLLTRQKEPRKKQNEDKGNLFHIPDYVDEKTLKPWTEKQ